MASIVKRGNTYRITVSLGRHTDGTQIRETTTFTPDPKKTEKQNEKALSEFVYHFEQKVKNGYISGEKITLEEFTQNWLKEYAEQELEESTLVSYKIYLEQTILPALGHIKLSELRPLVTKKFFNSLREDGARKDGKAGGYSEGTIKRMRVILSSILSSAVEWEYIASNPCYNTVRSKRHTRVQSQDVDYFTLDQAKAFLNCLNMTFPVVVEEHTRKAPNGKIKVIKRCVTNKTVTIPLQFKVLFNLAIFGGFRRGELLALTWDDIDFDNSIISITKSASYIPGKTEIKAPKTDSSIRKVSMPQSVMKLLRELKTEQLEYIMRIGSAWIGEHHKQKLNKNYLFTQANGKPMSVHTPRHKFQEIIKLYNNIQEDEAEKLPMIPFHGLRHTSATLLIAENIDIKTVSARLGHAQTSTTLDIYAHAIAKLDTKASNALECALEHNA